MDLIRNRKGILFTIISLVVSGFFMLVFSAQVEVPLDANVDVISFRVSLMDRFQESWEDYAGDAVRVSGYRALSEMADYTVKPPGYLFNNQNEFERNFEECLLNGTVNTVLGFSNCSRGPKHNMTLLFLLDSIVQLARSNLSLNTSYQITGVSVYQEFAFHVTVEFNMSYDIRDSIASITKNVSIKKLIPIEGLIDPLPAPFFGFYLRTIKETSIKDSEWNLGNLTEFVQNQEYKQSANATSYLQRFYADFTRSTCCGIEAVLSENIDGIHNLGVLENASYVDWMYFQEWVSAPPPTFPCDEIFRINGLAGVQLDQETLAAFNVSSSQWLTTC